MPSPVAACDSSGQSASSWPRLPEAAEFGDGQTGAMWATIVRDVMEDGEQRLITDVLEEVASPLDTYGWSSEGIYTWWAVDTREILYVGLAVDLPLRISQHVGRISCTANDCKREEIGALLDEQGRIGLSVMLQTSNTQPTCKRVAEGLSTTLEELERNHPGVTDHPLPGELQLLEGRLIEAHRLQVGHRPRWNKIGGAKRGAKQAGLIGVEGSFHVLAGRSDSPLVARPSLRELAGDPTMVTYEEYLHTARIYMVMFGEQGGEVTPTAFERALKIAEQMNERHLGPLAAHHVETGRRIQQDQYLSRPSAWLVRT